MKRLSIIFNALGLSDDNRHIEIDEKEIEEVKKHLPTIIAIKDCTSMSFKSNAQFFQNTIPMDGFLNLVLYRDGQCQVLCSTKYNNYESEWII